MPATVTIDDDLFAAVEKIAASSHTTVDQVVSRLTRERLDLPAATAEYRNGIRLLPRRDGARSLSVEEMKDLDEQILFDEYLEKQARSR
jgi:Arc/MetJ family transcription regulator